MCFATNGSYSDFKKLSVSADTPGYIFGIFGLFWAILGKEYRFQQLLIELCLF